MSTIRRKNRHTNSANSDHSVRWVFWGAVIMAGVLFVRHIALYHDPLSPVLVLSARMPVQIKSTADELEATITPWRTDKFLGSMVEQVLALLVDYRKNLADISTSSGDLTIDILLQNHGSDNGNTPAEQRAAEQSQSHVLQLLEKNRYDVIAVEGTDLNPITLDGMVDSLVRMGESQGYAPEADKIREWIVSKPNTAWAAYRVKYPDELMIGADDYPLNHLHHQLLYDFGPSSSYLKGQFLTLNQVLSRMRSEVAIVKTVGKLKEANRTRGAIVIGFSHQSDLKDMLQRLGIASTFYHTDLTN